jgi:ketosteroid isomerase-like protein
MSTLSTEEFANRWIHALSRDLSAFNALCSADCQVWHSTDAQWMTAQAAIDAASARGGLPPFENLRTAMTDAGFTVQMNATIAPAGKIHIVQLVTVKSGKATRVEEYIAPEMSMP